MLKNQVKVGGHYLAKVSGKMTTVRVDAIDPVSYAPYKVTNLKTGRRVTFRSAAKFRSEVKSPEQLDKGQVQAVVTEEAENRPDPTDANGAVGIADRGQTGNSATAAATVEVPNRPFGLASLRSGAAPSAASSNGHVLVAGYTPTDEQAAVLDAAREVQQSGGRCLVVAAGAGAGKTSTLKMLEETLHGRGQYTAFNKALCEDARSKFKKARVNTTHSLAFGAVGRRYAARLGGPRMRSSQIAELLGIEGSTVEMDSVISGEKVQKQLTASFLAGQVVQAIRKFAQSADPELTVHHFRYIDAIDTPKDGKRTFANNDRVKAYLLTYAKKAWDDLLSPTGQMPFTHDYYVKAWGLGADGNPPFIPVDYILLDESQDTAPVLLDILEQQKHAMLILVGDENQAIYGWRGATDAMKAFPDAPRRLLSQSFRFGQSAADVANSVLATLYDPTDLVMRGLSSIPSRVAPVANPRCILSRTNAAAVSALLAAQEEAQRGHLIGGGADVVAFVRAARDLKQGRGTAHPELACFLSWEEVEEYAKQDEGADLKLMVDLIKKFGVDPILGALENMPSEDKADLVLSTAHKSKGREWSSVRLASDFLPIQHSEDSDKRLLYVALTRAKHALDLSVCPAFCGWTDPLTHEYLPGLRLEYTGPMPSEEELNTYLSRKAVGKSPPSEVRSQSPEVEVVTAPTLDVAVPSVDVTEQPAVLASGTDFTWGKLNGEWWIRGPAGYENRTVTVSRRDGSNSQERLGKVSHTVGAFAFYELIRQR